MTAVDSAEQQADFEQIRISHEVKGATNAVGAQSAADAMLRPLEGEDRADLIDACFDGCRRHEVELTPKLKMLLNAVRQSPTA